jgi:type I restriction enzyme R subunit
MPGEPRVIVDASTANDRDKRIYLATYPAMMKAYEDFDVGFFDLIIADESHRSIYKKFRSLFQYFDALEVGLTATPVKFIERNTYELFACENGDPTSAFDFQQAIESKPPTSCRSA